MTADNKQPTADILHFPGVTNLGENGPESIRLRGQKIEDLPLGQGNDVVAQMPLVYQTQKTK